VSATSCGIHWQFNGPSIGPWLGPLWPREFPSSGEKGAAAASESQVPRRR